MDHCYRFVAVSIICAGATPDNLCLKVSNIGEYIRNGVSPLGFWIGGDDAYKPFGRLLKPICRLVVNAVQDAFNYFQSSHRVHVEQAFGFLKNKWGILWPLKFNLARANLTIEVAMKLQNYRINNDSSIPRAKKPQESVAQAREELDQWLLWYAEDIDKRAWVEFSVPGEEGEPGYPERIKSRRLLVELIKRKGVRRPSVAEMVERHMKGRKQSILQVEETYDT